MTLFQAGLLGFAAAMVMVVVAALAYTRLALLKGWPTLSGRVTKATPAQAALLGLLAGLLLGYLAGHWWPTVGNS